jgi:hypothetical protein
MIYKYKQYNESVDKIHKDIDISEEDVKKIAQELGYDDIKYRGHGSYGSAYELFINNTPTNKILKITVDTDEFLNANYLRKVNTKHLVNYYDARQILIKNEPITKSGKYNDESNFVYAILMDQIKSLTDFDEIIYRRFELNNIVHDEEGIYSVEELFNEFISFPDESVEKTAQSWGKTKEEIIDIIDFFIKQLNGMREEAARLEIEIPDTHTGNFGWRIDEDGKRYLTLIDVGIVATKRKNKILKPINISEGIHQELDKLEDSDIKIIATELGYYDCEWYAEGGYGVAYTVDDETKILKITSDCDEAWNANYLRKYNTKHLVNYYDVRTIRKYGNPIAYSIVMDKVDRLEPEERDIFKYSRLALIASEPSDLISYEYFITNQFSWQMQDKGFQLDEVYEMAIKQISDFVSTTPEQVIKIGEYLFKEMIGLRNEAKRLKIPLGDIAPRNLGWKDVNGKKTLVAYDIGVESTKSKNKKLKSIILS